MESKTMYTNIPQVNISVAVEMHETKLSISSKDICLIFDCGTTKANQLRKMVVEEMKNRNILQKNVHLVDIDVAYDVWGLNIPKLLKVYKNIQARENNANICNR